MNKFPELKNSIAKDIAYCRDNGLSVRTRLLEYGFGQDIKKGGYVISTQYVTALPQLVHRIDSYGDVCLLDEKCEKHFYPIEWLLSIPEECLSWSDGKDNKTVPLNHESLFIEGLKDPMLEREGLCQEIPLPLAEDVEYVTCTNNTGVGGCLTIGKEYEVVDRYVYPTGSKFIKIIDDNGLENGCYASRFSSKKEIKEGEYVTCINSGEMDSLTEMKDYVVKRTYVDEVGLHYVQIIDDSGYEGKYCPSHFIAKEDKGKDRFNSNFNIKSASAKAFKAAASEIRKRVEAGTFKIPAEQVRGAMKTWREHNDSLDYNYEVAHSDAPLEAFSLTNTGTTPYVVCPTTGRKLDPNTLIPLDEVVTFIDKSII